MSVTSAETAWLDEQEILARTAGAGQAMMLDFIEAEADRLGADATRYLNPREWPARRVKVRRELLNSLGLDPLPPRTPLNSKVVGTMQRDGYRIEKLQFEPRPNFRVPGLLYLPESTGAPGPAVLYSEGHWMRLGKSEPLIQACCIALAKLGFVVLVFDPIGQGERGASFLDHGHKELALLGLSQEGLMVWEHMRAVDYLLTRPEVDGNRIGMTGASGGGLSTVFTCAADERIAAAVPVCYIQSYRRMLRVMRAINWNNVGDLCNQTPNIIAFAEMAGLCGLIAPRPLLFISGSKDPQFPVAGAQEVLDAIRPVYEPVDLSRVGLFVVDADHGYDQEMRQAAYGWFRHWLMEQGDGSPVPEPPVDAFPAGAPELNCFPGGIAISSGPMITGLSRDVASRLQLNAEKAGIQTTTRKSIGLVLGLDLAPPYRVSGHVDAVTTTESLRLERHLITSEPGIHIPAYVAEPRGGAKNWVLYLDDKGKGASGFSDLLRHLSDRGAGAMAIDPRGVGETAPQPPAEMTLATLDGTLEKIIPAKGEHLEFETATDSWMLGRSLLGQQVGDVLSALDYLSSIRPAASGVTLFGCGPLSSLRGLFAAALDDRIHRLFVEELVMSLSSLVFDDQASFPVTGYVFGVLRQFDLADVVALLTDRHIVVARPVDARRRLVPINRFRRAYQDTLNRFDHDSGSFTVTERALIDEYERAISK